MVQPASDPHSTVEETLRLFGERLQQLRIRKSLTQSELARKADVSLRTIGNIERGSGGTLESLVRILRALDAIRELDALAPAPPFSPLAALKAPRLPKRVRKRQAP